MKIENPEKKLDNFFGNFDSKHIEIICKSILEVLLSVGKLIVTLLYQFPYHKGPIDTMPRPIVDQVHNMFTGTVFVDSTIVESKESYSDALKANSKHQLFMIARWSMPFYKYTEWKFMIKDYFNREKRHSATCTVLQNNKF